jgi:hypothetical protein
MSEEDPKGNEECRLYPRARCVPNSRGLRVRYAKQTLGITNNASMKHERQRPDESPHLASSLEHLFHPIPVTFDSPLPVAALVFQPPEFLATTSHLLEELRFPLIPVALSHLLP